MRLTGGDLSTTSSLGKNWDKSKWKIFLQVFQVLASQWNREATEPIDESSVTDNFVSLWQWQIGCCKVQ